MDLLSGYTNASTRRGLYTIYVQTIISPTDFEQDQRRPSQSRLLAYAGRRDEPHLSLTHTLYRRLSPAGRTRELECGLFSRGGLGKEDTLADAIPPFLLFFVVVFLIVSCLPPHCKILCTIVSPFLTQLGLLVMGGCITGWVSSVFFSCPLYAPRVSAARTSRFRPFFYYKAIIQRAGVSCGRTISY
ncbi:hypothetical protein B0J15DRAFT_282211 [Fusarium solani]|uniref:Uncharacterized protein n=1 Tax=Fusarium solani TaxID=169388 RepID=A0A9P9HN06_FUSSL|nr:uncharacterized protein B0J15DRAFT_282211 [Fusarium solani]KAH7260226.1 hypothetical protein B0J15DRAFT_282211 [Fusarium solani]